MTRIRWFRSVRAKLLGVVALFAVVTLTSLPAIYWLLHRQLLEEVHDRVASAEKAFQTEMDDDLADLAVTGRVIAKDDATVRALSAHDAPGAERLARIFVDAYPEFVVVIADSDGKPLARVNRDPARARSADASLLAPLLQGKETRYVFSHGCATGRSESPPAYALAEPVLSAGKLEGTVIVCMPLGHLYLSNSSEKLGLELALALVDTGAPSESALETTTDFPKLGTSADDRELRVEETGGKVWAVSRFVPRQFSAGQTDIGVVLALDVTDIQRILKRHLLGAIAVVLFATLLAFVAGSWLAASLSTPILRVTEALAGMDRQEYAHVEGVRTGDELELLATGFNRMIDGLRERDNLRLTFGKYMTAAVMGHLLAGKVQLGGESIEVTVLFSDIRSFTTISETMTAQNLVALLNEYFSEMVAIVMQEGGVVDKYIGDAIMAVFGAPVPKPGDATRAVRAAVRMRTALAELNKRLIARGAPPLRTGIGIHTGEVVAGNIGCEKRMEYTVIGDAVNVASRLESSTKELGAPVIISDDTYKLVQTSTVTRPIREITVKGRAQPIMTYEVLGLVNEQGVEELVPVPSSRNFRTGSPG